MVTLNSLMLQEWMALIILVKYSKLLFIRQYQLCDVFWSGEMEILTMPFGNNAALKNWKS